MLVGYNDEIDPEIDAHYALVHRAARAALVTGKMDARYANQGLTA